MTDLRILGPERSITFDRFLSTLGDSGFRASRVENGPDLAVLVPDTSQMELLRSAWSARRAGVAVFAIDDDSGTLGSRLHRFPLKIVTDRLVSRWVRVSELDRTDLAVHLQQVGALRSGDSVCRSGVDAVALDDLSAIVTVHCAAFPDSAMTRLGPAVVERYYRWQFVGAHPLPFARGAFDGGRLVGFVFGGLRKDAVSGFSRRFLASVLAAVVHHPLEARHLGWDRVRPVIRLMLGRRARPAGTPGVAETNRAEVSFDSPSFGVLSIALEPSARGSGLASELIRAAEREAVAAGCGRMHLTVERNNRRAIRFYEREGWTQATTRDGATVQMWKLLR
ncbi:MAG: GNAT family N-acetyltransferase [Acidimicrobiales bacterium]|nr:GNAT family N-acetyltransferase [Acidimicrobiales bacterium]MCB1247595.1 GNAT family N-acetyltransferase [Acidimicrobiia bacterium]